MAEREEKEWTLMFYFASDNPLAPEIVSQLKAITQAGFHPEANVIAQFDPHNNDNRTHIFDVNGINKQEADGQSRIGFVGFTPNDPYVVNLMIDKIWGDERDAQGKLITDRIRDALVRKDNFAPPSLLSESASAGKSSNGTQSKTKNHTKEPAPEKSLRDFLEFCRINYPARHYMLFILGHGLVVGNALFLFDENAEQPSLKLKTLGQLLQEFKDKLEPYAAFELISFHSCSMSSLEVAYELQDRTKELQDPTKELQGIANYMMASQGPAFVGSWPYRQILIRVFNDLKNSFFAVNDLEDAAGLANKLKQGEDPVSQQIRSRLAPDTSELLAQYSGTEPPSKELQAALVNELNRLLKESDLQETKQLQTDSQSDQRLLDRQSLAAAYPELKQFPPKSTIDVKGMLTRIFYYCLYNSYDFLIAGYSFDICLCNLNKATNLKVPLSQLSQVLIDSLENPRVKESILLAHWEAQSFWQENFTDLYDFCFCLERKLNPPKEEQKNPPADTEKPPAEFADIIDACNAVMGALKKGVKDNDDGFIVRAEFAGPKYQYASGMSVFFPWSIPTDINFWNPKNRRGEYHQYNFVKGFGRKRSWNDFLSAYFKQTRRSTHSAEAQKTGVPEIDVTEEKTPEAKRRILQWDLLEEFATSVFNESGQLSKGGGSSSTGDSDCDCLSVKNHPSFLREEVETVSSSQNSSGEPPPTALSQSFLDDPTVLEERAFISSFKSAQ